MQRFARASFLSSLLIFGIGFFASTLALADASPAPDAKAATKQSFANRLNWWSFKPLIRPSVPDAPSGTNPIDVFISAKLREKSLTPSPAADKRTLIRRLSFDLCGLPPSPQEIDDFLADTRPDAYERLVDRLLASPRYGERWARHWLDIVHYADTHGYDKDKVRPNAWPYRDYVIRAFNDDKPFARFVREQIAGDHFYPGTSDGLVALGFIAAGPWDYVGQVEVRDGTVDKAITRNLDRDDMVSATMNTFVSLTVQCARCHDHKFDPIRQEDYYSLQAVFAAVDRADRAYDADPGVARKRAELTAAIASTPAGRERDAASAALGALPAQSLVFAAATNFPAVGTLVPTLGKPRAIFLLRRGSEKSPDHPCRPGTVPLLPEMNARFADTEDESASRAALADWIVDSRNPLTWRSIVNRIWQYHFGRGLVETPSDFGHMGGTPSNQELLDWLAVEFRDGGNAIGAPQSIKALQKLIVTSAAYRQSSSAENPANEKLDSGNAFIWRNNRRRLDAEEIHDSVLQAAGELDLKMGGPGYRDFAFEDDHSPRYKYAEFDPDEPSSHRRAIYRFIVRSAPDPLMETLDCADPSQLAPRRNETLTPLQALSMLNNKLMVNMAAHFAQRVEKLSADRKGQVIAAYRLALGRDPTEAELAAILPLAEKDGLANVCRVIFNSNEFVFVD